MTQSAQKRPDGGRDACITASDEKLLAQCRMEFYRSSGPGGQHRNKTESAVRLTHLPTGVVATATERRNQHENRRQALARLRKSLAMEVREAVEPDQNAVLPSEHSESRNLAVVVPPGPLRNVLTDAAWPRVSQKSEAYLPAAARVLDYLAAGEAKVSDVAARLGVSTASLVKFLSLDDDLWQAANRIRQRFGQKGLK
jgi:hypothetical protein